MCSNQILATKITHVSGLFFLTKIVIFYEKDKFIYKTEKTYNLIGCICFFVK